MPPKPEKNLKLPFQVLFRFFLYNRLVSKAGHFRRKGWDFLASPLRHEYKIRLSLGEYAGLRARLRAVLPHDVHAGPSGEYQIRSVYFDNTEDKALREKLTGIDCREKFRLRWYNGDTSYLVLEKKSKHHGLCGKAGCLLTKEEACLLFHGDTRWMKESDRETARELALKMELQGLRPRTVVDYLREPFVFPPGNVRVTLDREIRGAAFFPDLLENPPLLLPAGNSVILEVKYDEFLPELIRDIVGLNSRGAGAFSKYAAARGVSY